MVKSVLWGKCKYGKILLHSPNLYIFWFCAIDCLNDELMYTNWNYYNLQIYMRWRCLPFYCIIIHAKLIQSSPSFMNRHQSNKKAMIQPHKIKILQFPILFLVIFKKLFPLSVTFEVGHWLLRYIQLHSTFLWWFVILLYEQNW